MEILLYILAVPLGLLILVAIFFIAGLIANYPGECFAILLLLVITFSLGAWALGLPPVW